MTQFALSGQIYGENEKAIMDFSIVIPIFNGGNDIFFKYQELTGILSKHVGSYELIYIDNYSRDLSLDHLMELKKNDPHIKIIPLDKNYGKPSAFAIGFMHAAGDRILAVDTDFKLIREDLLRTIAELKYIDAIFFTEKYSAWHLAGYQKKCLEALKLYKGFYKFMPLLLEIYGCSVKLFCLKAPFDINKKIKSRSLRCSLNDIFGIFVIRWMQKNKLKYKIVK